MCDAQTRQGVPICNPFINHLCTGQWMWTPALQCCGYWQCLPLLQQPCGQAAILLSRQSAFAAPLTMRYTCSFCTLTLCRHLHA